jgi:hypothetical protein
MFNRKKIVIDRDLYERIERVAGEAGYASVRDFIVHALEQHVHHLQQGKDEELIRKRLEGLGYID